MCSILCAETIAARSARFICRCLGEGAEMDFFFSDADDGMGLQPLTDADLRMLNEGELNPDDETHMVTNQFDADMQTTSPSSSAGNDGAVDDVTANVPMLQS